MSMEPVRRALRVAEVADRIGAGATLTRRMIKNGIIPSYRIGRCIRVDADVLERWILDRCSQQSARRD